MVGRSTTLAVTLFSLSRDGVGGLRGAAGRDGMQAVVAGRALWAAQRRHDLESSGAVGDDLKSWGVAVRHQSVERD